MPLQKCKFNTKQSYSIQHQLYSVISFSDSTPPPEQATNRRSQSNATNREGSDERYNIYSYTLCCVVPMSSVIDCYRQNEIEQADASHTGPGSDEK